MHPTLVPACVGVLPSSGGEPQLRLLGFGAALLAAALRAPKAAVQASGGDAGCSVRPRGGHAPAARLRATNAVGRAGPFDSHAAGRPSRRPGWCQTLPSRSSLPSAPATPQAILLTGPSEKLDPAGACSSTRAGAMRCARAPLLRAPREGPLAARRYACVACAATARQRGARRGAGAARQPSRPLSRPLPTCARLPPPPRFGPAASARCCCRPRRRCWSPARSARRAAAAAAACRRLLAGGCRSARASRTPPTRPCTCPRPRLPQVGPRPGPCPVLRAPWSHWPVHPCLSRFLPRPPLGRFCAAELRHIGLPSHRPLPPAACRSYANPSCGQAGLCAAGGPSPRPRRAAASQTPPLLPCGRAAPPTFL
jgi:hypothetical protein